ncbi:MAG: cyclic nucleotide-binding domain-containing protein [Chloroflexi bacterium]|nr:cyclic nucleotide-binding domain-containing protein [Chloroflexota bacterium]
MSSIEKLRTVPILAGLSDAQIGEILRVGRSRRVAANTALVREGETGNSLYILTEGSVEVTMRFGFPVLLPDDGMKEKLLVSLHAPQFFGEMGLLEGMERSATVTARRECEVLEISDKDFERLVAVDPSLGYQVVRNIAIVLSSRLRRTDRDVIKLTMALSLALGVR